jgi:FkbM family methyltransferase
MKLDDLLADHAAGRISKDELIERSYAVYGSLWECASRAAASNIRAVELIDGDVRFHIERPRMCMVCGCGDTRAAPIEMLNFGDYEHDELGWVEALLRGLEDGPLTFVDIGANIGFYSIAVAALFPSFRVIAFEPMPDSFANFERNIELNGADNVECHRLGLAATEGKLTFWTYPGLTAATSSVPLLDRPDCTEVVSDVVRIDDFLEETTGRIHFVKCDVEGAELNVLQGAPQLLARDAPVIMCEMLRKWTQRFEYHPDDIISYLGGFGYACFAIAGSKLSRCDAVTEHTEETNFVFLHEQRHRALADTLVGEGRLHS